MGLSVVTGASGLLGSYITETLVHRDQPVRALARDSSDVRLLKRLGVELLQGDLADVAFVQEAIASADVVYHCAGRIRNWGPWEDFERGNIVPTRNVVDACRRHQVRRLVHVSSLAVYGHPPGTEQLTEAEPLGQHLWSYDYYNRSKIAAERSVEELGDMATVVRPTWFFGPRDKAFVPRVLTSLRNGAVWVIGSPKNQLNGLYVTDLADGVILAGESPEAAGQAYNLCAEQGITQQELFDILCNGFDIPKVRRRVPLVIAHHFAHLVETFCRLTDRKDPPSISRHALSVLARPARFSSAKARRELGWKIKVTQSEGLSRSIDWIKRGEHFDELVIAHPGSQ
jgi:nucleoside-diphosphate-sugar epimerase